MEPQETGGVEIDHKSAVDVKKTSVDEEGNPRTDELIVEQGHEVGITTGETGGSVNYEGNLDWNVISTITIQPLKQELTACEMDCKNFCSELKDSKPDCMQTCNANFCAEAPAKVKVTKPKEKSYSVWGWLISIVILGVAVSVFLKKVAGLKTRRVRQTEVYEPSFNYTRI